MNCFDFVFDLHFPLTLVWSIVDLSMSFYSFYVHRQCCKWEELFTTVPSTCKLVAEFDQGVQLHALKAYTVVLYNL
jgi:hypothetical protein